MNYFQWFDVPQCWQLNADTLRQRYLELQRQMHPDRFAGADAAMQREAQKRSLELNQAYAELRDPVRRARHLLVMAGCELQDEGTAPLPGDFLMRQMELRELVAEGGANLDELAQQVNAELNQSGERLDELLQQGESDAGVTLLYQMQFLGKLLADIRARQQES